MQVIVFAASKGGVGKTTLTAAMAIEAAHSAQVAMADLDPQQCLARWHELRNEKVHPGFLNADTGIAAAAKRAEREGYDWLLVDTPPALMTRIAPVIAAADLVVIPVRPSPLDVEAVEPIIELCGIYKKPFVFVVNAVPAKSSLTMGTVGYLQHMGPVLKTKIALRNSYPGAMITGQTAGEIDRAPSTKGEIRALWQELKTIATAKPTPAAARASRTRRK